MEWGTPLALLLLLPVLALAWQPRLTGRNALLVSRGEGGWTLRRALAPLPAGLRIAGLALVVIALARPRVAHEEVVVESEGLDILLAIDTSGSMRAQDLAAGMRAVNRLEVAKGVMAEFVDKRPHDRIGLIAFGEEAYTAVPLTLDHDTLGGALDTIEIGIAGSRGTAIGDALAAAARRLEQVDAESRLVVLLTDGQSNAGRFSPVEAAKVAGAVGIKIYTVGVGAPRRGLGGLVGDGLDEDTLRAVAELTGGTYQRASSEDALRRVYDAIDQLEPTTAEVKEYVEYRELYRYALVPGLLALLLQVVLGATWLRVGP